MASFPAYWEEKKGKGKWEKKSGEEEEKKKRKRVGKKKKRKKATARADAANGGPSTCSSLSPLYFSVLCLSLSLIFFPTTACFLFLYATACWHTKGAIPPLFSPFLYPIFFLKISSVTAATTNILYFRFKLITQPPFKKNKKNSSRDVYHHGNPRYRFISAEILIHDCMSSHSLYHSWIGTCSS